MPGSDRPLVVVAGATGYLGGHVALALHAAGFRVRALTRDEERLGDARPACDEVFVGEATREKTLCGLCDGAWALFTSIGIRHIRPRPTFLEVDRDANLNLVRLAEEAGVSRFIYTSVLGAPEFREKLPLLDAKEQVADRLHESTMQSTVIRPTGLFNDMVEFFEMARRGRVWLLGQGAAQVNPIHGTDVGEVVVGLLGEDPPPPDADLGGPDVFTMKQIGELAFEALQRPARFGSIPTWVLGVGSVMTRPFNRNLSALLAGFHMVNTKGAVGPRRGKRTLPELYEELAAGLMRPGERSV